MKKVHPFFLVLLLAVAAGGGCYTVLSHPETLDQPAEGVESKACSDCHSDADLYHYTDSYNMGWYDSYPAPWAAYYATPWWYDNYWAYEPNPGDPNAPRVERGRHLWSRGSTGGSGFLPIQGTRDALAPATPASPTTPEKPSDGTKPTPPEKEKKTEKRRLWGR
jgi:hypothetical protein